MKEVTLRSAVPYRNGVLKAGTRLEVSDEQAKTWEEKGLLHGDGPTEQDLLGDADRATALFIGLQHGDASAIAEVQRLLAQARGPHAPGAQPGSEMGALRADYARDAAQETLPNEPVFASPAQEAAEDDAIPLSAAMPASGEPRRVGRSEGRKQ